MIILLSIALFFSTSFLLLIAAKPVRQGVRPVDTLSIEFHNMLRAGVIMGFVGIIVWSFTLILLGGA